MTSLFQFRDPASLDVPVGLAISLLKEAGFHVCSWDPGSAGDSCHEPESPHYQPVSTDDIVAVLYGQKKLDQWGRAVPRGDS